MTLQLTHNDFQQRTSTRISPLWALPGRHTETAGPSHSLKNTHRKPWGPSTTVRSLQKSCLPIGKRNTPKLKPMRDDEEWESREQSPPKRGTAIPKQHHTEEQDRETPRGGWEKGEVWCREPTGGGSQTVSWEHEANKECDCPDGCSQSSSEGCWLLGGDGGPPQKGNSQPAGGAADVLQLRILKTRSLLQTNSLLGQKNNKTAKTYPVTKLKLSILQLEELLSTSKAVAHQGSRTAHWKPRGGTAVLHCSQPPSLPPPADEPL